MNQDYWGDMFCAAVESTFQLFPFAPCLAAVESGEEFIEPTPEFVFSIECNCCGKSVNVSEVYVCWDCGRVECWSCHDDDEGANWSQCEICYRHYCDCNFSQYREVEFICDRCDDSAENPGGQEEQG